MKNKILVTGGTGYIGSHTVVELQNAGFDVLIVDNLSNSSPDVINGIEKITGKKPELIVADCADITKMDEIFSTQPAIVAIIHFAASKAVGESVEKPLLYYRNNLLSLVNMLELSLKYGIHNFVFSSSCTVYGQPEILPVTESSPIQEATSPYGNTKQIAEEIIRDTVRANSSLKAICLRYFNPIGAHPSALIGELPNGVPNNLVPFITQTAIGLRECLSIFGNDYNTPDGSCIRDYINVVDLAKAHVVAVKRMLDNKNKQMLEFFNIGTGKGLSVLELVHVFEETTGVKPRYKIVGRRAGDIEQIWANASYANNELGWRAEEAITDTLLSAWKWEQALASKK
ncbi:MAG: UDP-glucose 4-epimerase GalE [Prevotellaceae bacterium]|jgi:UDP-glucose 4-epimerase|nr:UDP-glucose 4-epimerase GalE [Prevotellaceae bacterium]